MIFEASSTRSHGSPGYIAPQQIAFEASSTDPPPTATTKSIPSSLQRLTPSRTDVIFGFGSIPPNSETEQPALSSSSFTRVKSPERFTEPPPYVISAFFPAPATASFSSEIRPFPKIRWVGM